MEKTVWDTVAEVTLERLVHLGYLPIKKAEIETLAKDIIRVHRAWKALREEPDCENLIHDCDIAITTLCIHLKIRESGDDGKTAH